MPAGLFWDEMKAFELRKLAEEGYTVLQPVASTEQHGPGLPVGVDTLLCAEVARRTAERVAEAGGKVVVAPCLHVGLAEHHMPFGGTLTLDVATYKGVLKGLTGSMVREGFKRILLLNGHGGNETALKNISQELSTELDATIATASYWTIPSVAVAYGSILTAQSKVMHAGTSVVLFHSPPPHALFPSFVSAEHCHSTSQLCFTRAGEGESSMMLALRPDLCDMKAMETLVCPPIEEGMMDVRGIYRWQSFADYTPTGVLGVPAAGANT